ncbi:MAG: lipoprotein [Gemmataceae bacterium]
MRATVFALLLGASALTLAGCGQKKEEKTTMDIKDVPPDIMRVAKEKLPDVAFGTAWKKPNGTIEVRGKTKNGKVREIDIRPDGTVEEIE